MSKCKSKRASFIHDVQVTNDCLTGRAGLNLFARYLRGIDLFPHLDRLFGSMRKHPKGAPIDELFKQILCFLFDGTSRHLAHFDVLAKDPGYAAAIETDRTDMASSHTIKRFYRAFSPVRTYKFRHLLQQLFLWRLTIARPDVIELNIDTMVMDNDQAPKRHGVKPTYKKVKGFQPLQMTWGRFIIDAVFRGGDKHSNNGDTAEKMIRHVVRMIRTRYSETAPIIIRMDSGFFDQDLFAEIEKLDIGFICGGKFYGGIKAMIETLPRPRMPTTSARPTRMSGSASSSATAASPGTASTEPSSGVPCWRRSSTFCPGAGLGRSPTPTSAWAGSLISSCETPALAA